MGGFKKWEDLCNGAGGGGIILKWGLIHLYGLCFNRSGAAPAVALDISKTFNRVYHVGLLHKLKSSLLSNRQSFPFDACNRTCTPAHMPLVWHMWKIAHITFVNDTFCLGHWNKENERKNKNIKCNSWSFFFNLC